MGGVVGLRNFKEGFTNLRADRFFLPLIFDMVEYQKAGKGERSEPIFCLITHFYMVVVQKWGEGVGAHRISTSFSAQCEFQFFF